MKIIVLGGAGDMGSRAVEDLAASEDVRRVTIADRNVTAAHEIAARIGNQGAEVDVQRIDANDHQGLVDAMWGGLAGEQVHRIACGIGQMREATGLSLSIGTRMLARKELLTDRGGVYAPEACLDPAMFIAAMGAKGIRAYEDLAMTRPIG